MAVSGLRKKRRMQGRRLAARLDTLAAVALALVIAGMLHYLAARHFRRWDVSRSALYALTEPSRSLLKGLDLDVEAVLFLESGHALYREIDTQLREYEYASPRFRVSRVDPDRDPGRTEELIRRFPVTERNVVIFHAGDRAQVVRADDVADFEDVGPDGGHRRMSLFRGESLFSSAILSVARPQRPRVLFLSGQGEKSADSTEDASGLSTLARLIRQNNIEVETQALAELDAAGADADAWIIAGPRHRFAQPLIDRVEARLEGRGRALFLLDSGVRTGLEPMLERHGVRVGDDVVVDPARTVTGREVLLLRYAGRHPITRGLEGVTSVFYLPRSVEPVNGAGVVAADRPRVTRLALTSDQGWAERDYDRQPMVFDPGRDVPGPVSVAAAVERGVVDGLDAELTPARLVVFGDSSFVANGRLTGGNADLFLGALHWLLDREERALVPPRPVQEIRVPFSRAQMRWLAWLVLGALPGAAAVLGILVRFRRRR